ncbi:zinc-ribbon domain containing protein [Hydrogenophaga sp. 5NK40-0174]|uniref:zinc-ribbon domain containing protein n=1 Tax=Hydrogenophaga sp. 5NK40-0174 TaxID=3127649 RepID=UPI0031048389
MKSNKQRRAELRLEREHKKTKQELRRQLSMPPYVLSGGALPVNRAALQPMCCWPGWGERGFYQDLAFTCKDCGAQCVWAAKRQKWWYEVMKAHPDTTAVRCAPCRAKERARKASEREKAQGSALPASKNNSGVKYK